MLVFSLFSLQRLGGSSAINRIFCLVADCKLKNWWDMLL